MSTPFQLDALEKFLLRAATIGGYSLIRSYVNGHGQVVAEVWLKRGDEVVEKAKFLVRGHSAVEMSADDPRGRPARKPLPATKG